VNANKMNLGNGWNDAHIIKVVGSVRFMDKTNAFGMMGGFMFFVDVE